MQKKGRFAIACKSKINYINKTKQKDRNKTAKTENSTNTNNTQNIGKHILRKEIDRGRKTNKFCNRFRITNYHNTEPLKTQKSHYRR